jgi:hypothetical protein
MEMMKTLLKLNQWGILFCLGCNCMHADLKRPAYIDWNEYIERPANVVTIRANSGGYIGISETAPYQNATVIELDLGSATGPVTIAPTAFKNFVYLTKISDPQGCVKKIGNYAFTDCERLSKVQLSKVTEIGDAAFKNCKTLCEVKFNQAQAIGHCAFKGCEALRAVKCDQVTEIGTAAFQNCLDLCKVQFDRAQTIWCSAFAGCTNLQRVHIPLCHTLYWSAFQNTPNLARLCVSKACEIDPDSGLGSSIVYGKGKSVSPDETSLIDPNSILVEWTEVDKNNKIHTVLIEKFP